MIIHLVDGTYELFRHFYGLRRFRVKGFASRGSPGRTRANVLRLPIAFHERQWVLHRLLDGLGEAVSEHTRGASFATKSRGRWKLIYYEAYAEREDAEGREKFLTSGAGRRFLRIQLRHYLRVKGCASRRSDHEAPTFH